MTTAWTRTTLVQVDHDYDRSRADDGHSRFGAYVRARVDEIFEEDRTDPAAFAIWAWYIATPPVMSPGYVNLRPDLKAVKLTRDEDADLAVEVAVPLPRAALAREVRPPYDVEDWGVDHYGGLDDRYKAQWPPARIKRAAVLLTATVLVPAGDWDLFVPGGAPEQLVDDAQLSVQTIVRHINSRVGPYVSGLLGESR